MKKKPCLFCTPEQSCPDCERKKLMRRKNKLVAHFWWLIHRKTEIQKDIEDQKRVLSWEALMSNLLEEKESINQKLKAA